MSKYIGTNTPYGLYEKQLFQLEAGKTDFALDYRVGYTTSILVVYQIAGSARLLEPGHEYDLIEGGTKIRITFETYNNDAYEERLYAIYLGKQLSIPVPLEKRPLLVQKTNITGTEIAVAENVYLDQGGLIIFKNGTQLRHGATLGYVIGTSGNSITLNQAAVSSDVFDIHIFSGIQRSSLVPLEDNSVGTEKLKPNCVSSDKLDLRYVDYTLLTSDISGLGVLATSSTSVLESTHMVQGTPSSLYGVPVKVRVKFTTVLTGAVDTIVRFNLPQLLPNVSTVIAGNITISNSESVESGILTWGATNSVDIHRQFGVAFSLGAHTFEAAFEYITKQ